MKAAYIVIGMLKQGENINIRFISEKRPEKIHGTEAEPNCEDAYMYCLYQNGCSVNEEV